MLVEQPGFVFFFVVFLLSYLLSQLDTYNTHYHATCAYDRLQRNAIVSVFEFRLPCRQLRLNQWLVHVRFSHDRLYEMVFGDGELLEFVVSVNRKNWEKKS